MSKPIISYVIPCYNCVTTIADTINSIKDSHEHVRKEKNLPSLWDQMEVILVDDASTDNTSSVLKWFAIKYPNVKLLNNGVNRGPGYCRNIGNQAAESDIIAVLDSDDLNIGDRTSKIINTFEENPKAQIFYSSFLAVHTHTNHQEPFEADKIDVDYLRRKGEFCIGHSTVAYKKEAIIEHPYSEDRKSDDWFMLWQFFTHGLKFTFTKKFLVAYMIEEKKLKRENTKEKQMGILAKKKKIMDPYFEAKEVANV